MNKSILMAVVLIGFISFCSPAFAWTSDWNFSTASETTVMGYGLLYNGTYFWIPDYQSDIIYRYNNSGIYNSSSIDISAKCHHATGLTKNTTFFWIVCNQNTTDYDTSVYRYTVAGAYSGVFNVNSNFSTQEVGGITMNATYFWIPNRYTGQVFRYTMAGVYSGVFDTSGETMSPTAITFNGTYFWISDGASTIYRYNSTGHYNNTAIDVSSKSSYTSGVAINGTQLYIQENSGSMVYRFIDSNYVVNTFDEETGSAIASWNIYLNNGTKTDTLAGITNAYNNYSSYWSGTNILTQVSKTGYATRNFYVTISNEGTYYLLNAYLLNSTNGNYIRLHVYDGNSNPLPNSTVVAKRYIGTAWTEVEHTITDSSGTATMFMSPITTYNVNVTNPNCTSKEFNIMPTSSDYSIMLSCGAVGNLTNTTSPSDNLTISIAPIQTALCNTTYTFMYNVTDLNGWLSQYGVSLVNSSGSVLWSAVGTNNNGTNLSSAINLGSQSGTLHLNYNFTRTPYSTFYSSKSYFVSYYNCIPANASNYSLAYTINQINTGYFDISPLFLLILALFLSLTAVGVSSYLGNGSLGGSLIFISVFIMLSYAFNLFEIFSWKLVLLSIMGAISVIIITKING